MLVLDVLLFLLCLYGVTARKLCNLATYTLLVYEKES